MNWTGKRVLVTGSGGFIGSHLAERLVEKGARVRAFVHYNALGKEGWLDLLPVRKELEVVAGDICDYDYLFEAMREIDIVFHLAALIDVPHSYKTPRAYVRTNIEGSLNVLQAARERNIERLIHTSSSEIYGTARYVPMNESHPVQAQSPYAATKVAADQLAESFHRSYGVPVTIVRPFNTFGPRQSIRAVVPAIITQCIEGNVIRLGNVHPSRDLTYVTDTVEGFVLAASSPDAIGKTLNLGTGKGILIKELAHLIIQLMDRSVEIEIDQNRVRPSESEVTQLLSDNTFAQDLLGWKPQVGLEEGLKTTIEWIKQNSEKYRQLLVIEP